MNRNPIPLGWGGGVGRKGIQLQLNNNKIFFKNPIPDHSSSITFVVI